MKVLATVDFSESSHSEEFKEKFKPYDKPRIFTSGNFKYIFRDSLSGKEIGLKNLNIILEK